MTTQNKSPLMLVLLAVFTFAGGGNVGCDDLKAQAPGEKATFAAAGVSFNMVYVPGKSFKTGIDDNGDFDGDGKRDVPPTATVTNAYWIGETELTHELWNAVYTWAITSAPNVYHFANTGRMGSIGIGSGSNQEPVTMVNWRDAMVWCNAATEWYNAKNGTSYTCAYYSDSAYTTPIRDSRDGTYGKSVNNIAGSFDNPYVKTDATGFRLLTSNEWELAARYHTDANNDGDILDVNEYCPGNYASGARANYTNANANGLVAVYNARFTAIVKSKGKANELGLYDMSGNVLEWCVDWHPLYIGSYRVGRGGSWNDSAFGLQVGYVNADFPYIESYDIGFRLAKSNP